jgi:hypothetical protein
MRLLLRAASVGLALACSACGPVVSQVSSAPSPPKPGNCTLQYLKAAPVEGDFRFIGQVVVQDEHPDDAFSKERRALLQPRACRLGGDTVAVLPMPSPSPHPVPVTNYGIFRRSL